MELKIDIADFCILTPFPGTPFYNRLEAECRLNTKDWSRYNLKTPVFKPKHMTEEELVYGVRKMYNEFYSPIYTIKRIIKSLRYGFYPFFIVLARNLVATMNSRKIMK